MPCSIDVSGKSALVWGKSGVMGVNGGKVDLEGNGGGVEERKVQ